MLTLKDKTFGVVDLLQNSQYYMKHYFMLLGKTGRVFFSEVTVTQQFRRIGVESSELKITHPPVDSSVIALKF